MNIPRILYFLYLLLFINFLLIHLGESAEGGRDPDLSKSLSSLNILDREDVVPFSKCGSNRNIPFEDLNKNNRIITDKVLEKLAHCSLDKKKEIYEDPFAKYAFVRRVLPEIIANVSDVQLEHLVNLAVLELEKKSANYLKSHRWKLGFLNGLDSVIENSNISWCKMMDDMASHIENITLPETMNEIDRINIWANWFKYMKYEWMKWQTNTITFFFDGMREHSKGTSAESCIYAINSGWESYKTLYINMLDDRIMNAIQEHTEQCCVEDKGESSKSKSEKNK